MQITQLETIRLGEFPNILWVRLHTDEGLVGLGETFMGAQAVEAYLHEWAAPRLMGQDPLAIEARNRDLTGYLGWRGSGVETRGNSAVDIALWDLFGKAAGMPVHTALGGKSRDAIRIYNTCAGYQYIRSDANQTSSNWGLGKGQSGPSGSAGPYEDLQGFLHHADELAQSLLSEGVTAMKIWPFDPAAEASHGQYISNADLDAALEPFRKIREAVGDRMDIMVEFHSLWRLPMAQKIARALKPFNTFWHEDAIRMDSLDLLEAVREGLRGADLRQRDAQLQVGLQGLPANRRGRRRDARPELVRRPDRSAQDRRHGRCLAAAGGAARLHRAGGVGRLDAPVAARAQRADPGERARLLHRLVQGTGDRAAGREERDDHARRQAGPGTGTAAGPAPRADAMVRVDP